MELSDGLRVILKGHLGWASADWIVLSGCYWP